LKKPAVEAAKEALNDHICGIAKDQASALEVLARELVREYGAEAVTRFQLVTKHAPGGLTVMWFEERVEEVKKDLSHMLLTFDVGPLEEE